MAMKTKNKRARGMCPAPFFYRGYALPLPTRLAVGLELEVFVIQRASC
jgi:hypothetical protein